MKFQHPILRRFAGFAVSTLARHWMRTLDRQAAFYDVAVDPAHADFRGPAIYVFWHEYILAPFYLRGHCNLAMLLSRHRDADWLAEAAAFMGFGVVRGSSFRGGSAALRELTRTIREEGTSIAITPDGPRGPRRKLAPGPIFLASKLQIPIVAAGIGYDRPRRLQTWDCFALPRLFSRGRIILSPRLSIPADLDRDGVQRYQMRVERLLNRLTLEAEAWASSGTGKCDQIPAVPRPSALQAEYGRVSYGDLPAHPSIPLPAITSSASRQAA